jgi:hypothetical protein
MRSANSIVAKISRAPVAAVRIPVCSCSRIRQLHAFSCVVAAPRAVDIGVTVLDRRTACVPFACRDPAARFIGTASSQDRKTSQTNTASQAGVNDEDLAAYTAGEADLAKGGTHNYRAMCDKDHLYTNIDVTKRVSAADSGSISHHEANAPEKEKDLRDTEMPNPEGKMSPEYFTSEYFPESMHLEPETGEFFDRMADGRKVKTAGAISNPNAKRPLRAGDSPEPINVRSGFYPDTMLLEQEIRDNIPPGGLPRKVATDFAHLDEGLHNSAGYFPDTGVTDPEAIQGEETTIPEAAKKLKGAKGPRMM